MASGTLIPVTEYLETTYRPDCDYIDGELRERNVGEQPHAAIQAIFAGIFREHRATWKVLALTEQRIQTSSTHYLIADVCILRRTDPFDRIVHKAPLICIEVLSRGDTLSDMLDRVDDYANMGVQHIWIIDPGNRRGYVASTSGLQQPASGELTVPGTPIRISLAEIWAEFDELQPQG